MLVIFCYQNLDIGKLYDDPDQMLHSLTSDLGCTVCLRPIKLLMVKYKMSSIINTVSL